MRGNILIHSNYHPENHGGIEYVVSELIAVARGMDFSVTCFYGGLDSKRHIDMNKVKHIQRRIFFKVKGLCFLSLGNIFFYRAARESNIIIFQEPYPYLWPSLFLLRLMKKGNIVLLAHADPVAPPIIKKLYSIVRSIVFNGTKLVATSPQLLDKLKISTKYSEVIPLGIDKSFDEESHLTTNSNQKNSYVLYFGRLAEYKGIEYLLESIKNLPEIEFVIAGNGPLSRLVSEFIRDNKLNNIEFINESVSDKRKVDLIRNCAFLVFPSTTENEAFGIVQLEAMRESKAIVNTLLNNGVNFVAPHDVCAVTCQPKNHIALAQAISLLWNDVELRARLSVNSRDRFLAFFTNYRFREAWSNLLQGLANKPL